MAALTAIVCVLALYGLLALLTQLVPRQQHFDRFGGVVDTRADRTLGYMPPELRAHEQAMRGAVAASLSPLLKEPT